MSEPPSLSVVERAGLVRLRSEAGDLALAGAGWGAKPTPSEAGVGGGSGGGGGPSCASGVGRRVESADGAVRSPTAG
jgi:hypothetical protein